MVNKNMNLVNKVKDKWDERKFKRLEKEVIRLQGDTSWFPNQQKNLKTEETTTTFVEEEGRFVMKKHSLKPMDKKTGRDKGEESSYRTRPDGLCKEGKKPITTMSNENVKKIKGEIPTNGEPSLEEAQLDYNRNKRPRKRSNKRCHFCRKRGHIKKNCPIKQKCWNWMKGGSVRRVEII